MLIVLLDSAVSKFNPSKLPISTVTPLFWVSHGCLMFCLLQALCIFVWTIQGLTVFFPVVVVLLLFNSSSSTFSTCAKRWRRSEFCPFNVSMHNHNVYKIMTHVSGRKRDQEVTWRSRLNNFVSTTLTKKNLLNLLTTLFLYRWIQECKALWYCFQIIVSLSRHKLLQTCLRYLGTIWPLNHTWLFVDWNISCLILDDSA